MQRLQTDDDDDETYDVGQEQTSQQDPGPAITKRLEFDTRQHYELEREFREDYYMKYGPQVVKAIIYSSLLWSLFIINDIVKERAGLRKNFTVTISLRLCNVVIAWLVVLLFRLQPHLLRKFEPITSVVMIMFSACGVIFGVIEGDTLDPTYSVQTILIGSMCATFFRLRFSYSVATIWVMCVIYIVLTAVFRTYDTLGHFGLNIALIVGSKIIFSAHAYNREYYVRVGFLAAIRLRKEEERSHKILGKMLPETVLERMKEGADFIYAKHNDVSVLFSHIHDFDSHTARSSALDVVKLLNRLFSTFDVLTDKYSVYKVETIGDVYLVSAGCPTERQDHAAVLCVLALDMQASMSKFQSVGKAPIELRIGINSGPVIAGVVGAKYPRYRLMGDTVNTASRMSTTCRAKEIQLSLSTMTQLVATQEEFICEYRGEIPVKGKGSMKTYLCKGYKGKSFPAFTARGFERNANKALEAERQATLQKSLLASLPSNLQAFVDAKKDSSMSVTRGHPGSSSASVADPPSTTSAPQVCSTPRGGGAGSPTEDTQSSEMVDRIRDATRKIRMASNRSSFMVESSAELPLSSDIQTDAAAAPSAGPAASCAPSTAAGSGGGNSGRTVGGSHIESPSPPQAVSTLSAASPSAAVASPRRSFFQSRSRRVTPLDPSVPPSSLALVPAPNRASLTSPTAVTAALVSPVNVTKVQVEAKSPTAGMAGVGATAKPVRASSTMVVLSAKNQMARSETLLLITEMPPINQILDEHSLRRFWSLRFARLPQLEERFQQTYFSKFSMANRQGIGGLLLCMCMLAVYDTLANLSDVRSSVMLATWIVRIFGFLIGGAIFGLTFTRYYHLYNMQNFASAMVITTGVVIIQNDILFSTYTDAYGVACVFLLISVVAMFFGMQYRYFVVSVSFVLLYYFAVGWGYEGRPPQVVFFLLAGAAIYVRSAWASEFYLRRDFLRYVRQEKEEQQARTFLNNMLPDVVLKEIKNESRFIAHERANASVLFCDVVSFTTMASKLEPEDVVAILNVIFSTFDQLTTEHRVYKVETIGDAYMACSGVVTLTRQHHTKDLVDCAIAFRQSSESFYTPDRQNIRIRIGIHTGAVIAGVVGRKMPRYHLFGETVTVAEEVENKGLPGEVVVSETTLAALDNEYDVETLAPIALPEDRSLGKFRMIRRKPHLAKRVYRTSIIRQHHHNHHHHHQQLKPQPPFSPSSTVAPAPVVVDMPPAAAAAYSSSPAETAAAAAAAAVAEPPAKEAEHALLPGELASTETAAAAATAIPAPAITTATAAASTSTSIAAATSIDVPAADPLMRARAAGSLMPLAVSKLPPLPLGSSGTSSGPSTGPNRLHLPPINPVENKSPR